MPRLQPDDAPPGRTGGLLGGKRTVEVGCRAQQAFHASAGIVEGGESFAENSDPWVASDRGRQQSYPVSRLLAHRLRSSHHAAFEAVLMSCRVVGKPRWPSGLEVVIGDAERGTPHREVARQDHVRGVRYRLGPRESRPRRWIGGGRMHLIGEITHPTREIGEVAAPPLGVIEGGKNVC
jgi:hypothetical protein